MKKLALSNWGVTFVDNADYPRLKPFKWFAMKDRRRVYAARAWTNSRGVKTIQRLHSFLLPRVKQVDHKDGDGLNNQRKNLRPARQRQNQQGHQNKRTGTSSKFRGVSWHSGAKKWKASIVVRGRSKHIGLFDREIDAAKAWDGASFTYPGKFAFQNL